MNTLKKAFVLLLILLIYIGDMVIASLQSLSYKTYVTLKYISRVGKRPIWSIGIATGFILHRLFMLPVFIVGGTIVGVGALLKGFKKIFIRKKKVRLKHYTPRHGYSRPGILYKFKFFFIGTLFSFLFLFLPLLFFIFIGDLPNPYNLTLVSMPQTTKIYDRNNILLYEIFANQNRTVVNLADVPDLVQKATIAIEDKNFHDHIGIDLRGILRAAVSNLQQNEIQGGSTITQQLIKSAFLTPEVSLQRKVKEVALAFWAERVYTKDEILELYFNYVPYGGTAWGIQAASEVYFGKKIGDVDLAEAAFLAGIPRAPTIYSPYSGDSTIWKKRQKEVLDAMVRENYVTKDEANNAYNKELTFKSPRVPIRAPHFVMFVRDYLVKKYGLSQVERGGLRVTTTLDVTLQDKIEAIVREQVEKDSYLNISNGATVVTNPKTGEILAMVGSRDYFDDEKDGNVNIVTSLRQPGSTIKLVTYTLALSTGFTEATIIEDSPLSIPQVGGPTYTPVNYDGQFHGKLPIRLVFANSLNIPAVKVAQQLGVERIVNFGKKMGITSWGDFNQYGISITLGGGEVTMLDLATIYGTVANNGRKIVPDPLLKVDDSKGVNLYIHASSSEQVVDEGVSYIIRDILSDDDARSMEFGRNSPLAIPGHTVSVKTGTTDNKRDNWTVGFTQDYLVATWVGNNDNTPMSQALTSGITGAAPMWNRIITLLLEGKKTESTPPPSNIIRKSCYGRTFNFIIGTEGSVNCSPNILPSGFPTYTPSPSQPPVIEIREPQAQILEENDDNRGRRRRNRNT